MCLCTRNWWREFAYTQQGLLKEKFLDACLSMLTGVHDQRLVYCQDCPLERSKNEQCKGHIIRKFIKECWRKCGCNMNCGNRVVQRGITCELQVFLTGDGKGWGLRTLQDLPKGTFVCEYVGEILTNTELYERNMKSNGSERHTYPVTLDADRGSKRILKDEEALCLDATFSGNVARFINHRCFDANLTDIPVEVETPDRHFYHLALFTARNVNALEELTWSKAVAARIQLNGCYFHYVTDEFIEEAFNKHELLHKICGEKGADIGFEELRDEAFAAMESGVIDGHGFYSGGYGSVHVLAQCEGDLGGCDCGECVISVAQIAQEECIGSISGQIYLDRCSISYSYYPYGVPGNKYHGGGNKTGKSVAIVLGGAAALFFGLIFLMFIKSFGKKDDI